MNLFRKVVKIVKSWFSTESVYQAGEVKHETIEKQSSVIPSVENPPHAEILHEIILGEGQNSIILSRIDDFGFSEGWEPLIGSNNANLFSQAAGIGVATGSAMFSAQGLYQATVSPDKLLRYNNGTLSSITLNGKSFGGHAGFVNVNTAVFTPVLIFQFASMLTGQYYFNGMTKQLNSIQKGIDQILQFHSNERIAKIKVIAERISALEGNDFFTSEDFVAIDNIKMELSIIRYEYLLAANQQLKQFLFPGKDASDKLADSIEVGNLEALKIGTVKLFGSVKEDLLDIYKDSGTEGVFKKIGNFIERSGNKAYKLVQKVIDSKFIFFIEAALEADKLFQYMQLLELKANLSYKNPDQNRIGKINQLYNNLKKFDESTDSIYSEVAEAAQHLQRELLALLLHYKQNTFMNKTEICQHEAALKMEFKRLDKYNGVNAQYKRDRLKIEEAFSAPVEFIIDSNQGSQLYVKRDKNNLITST